MDSRVPNAIASSIAWPRMLLDTRLPSLRRRTRPRSAAGTSSNTDNPLGLRPSDTRQLVAYWAMLQEAKVVEPALLPKSLRRNGRGIV